MIVVFLVQFSMSERSQFNLSRLAIKYSRITVCFWLAIAIAGVFAFSSLKYSLFPAVNFPVVVIRAQADTDSVLETETQITKPLENAVSDLDGLAQLFSSSYPKQTVINLLLDTTVNAEAATDEIKGSLSKLSLPDTDIEVIPFNLNETSAISYVVTDENNNLAELNKITTDKIIPALTQLSGVQRVDILGISEPDRANSDIPTANSNTLIRFNGKSAIAFQVIKQSDANTLEVVQKVERQIEQLKPNLSNIEIILAQTPAGYIREATKSTIEALLSAVALAVLIIFPFLRNFRATLITAIAIPISLLGTFIVMAGLG
ncbi:MAG: efflux RND transporter permease subunit, partial [Cyanobacteria bacterium P01_G01_bin.19]